MKKIREAYMIPLLSVVFALSAPSQSIGINTATPDSSAMLDIHSESKGILIPRLTTSQRATIADPAVGLQIYNTDINCLQFYNGLDWMNCCGTPDDPFTEAMAGSDRMTTSDTLHLQANSPGLGETGMWSVISGTGGSFSDNSDPHAVFFSNGNFQTYLLRWTISNPCGSTYDEVELRFHQQGIYVSFLGSDISGDGTPANPFRTIQYAINQSLTQSTDKLFISEGSFPETLTINNPADTVHIIGGHYAFDWNIQDAETHVTLISGGTTAMTVSNTSSIPVTIEALEIHSSKGTAGVSSIVVKASTAVLSVQSCILKAGDGGPGLDGADGSDGFNGNSGGPGLSGNCNPPPFPTGGSGGIGAILQTMGGIGGMGGDGDDNNGAGPSGQSGANGSGPLGGSGGIGGPGVGPCNSSICNTPLGIPNGQSGNDGGDGISGTGGTGLNFIAGNLIAVSGANGFSGSGGGGGGGGGGCGGLENCGGGGFGTGNSGGGGGGGGGSGSGAFGGTGGGSSLGIQAVNTTLTVQATIFFRGNGGNGGTGGKGGNGGLGGNGGPGLANLVGGVVSLSGDGGNGGKGGLGGHGGGGSGGSSIGIAKSGGTLNQAANVFNGGNVGQGGKSLANNGSAGILSEVFGS